MVVRLSMRDLLLWYVVGEDPVLARASIVRGLYSENLIHLNDKMPQSGRALDDIYIINSITELSLERGTFCS